MASSRAIKHFLHQRNLLLRNVPPASSLFCCTLPRNPIQTRRYSTNKHLTSVEHKNSANQVQVGFAEVVKEKTKMTFYLGVILAGTGITAIMAFTIFKELFSSKSPNGVYSNALKRCMKDPKLLDNLGEPIKAYGEETRRGRRGHVSHTEYEQDGVSRMRMQFYIQGTRKRGTVHLEVQENESGDYEYRYLFVQLEDFARTTIILEDNRGKEMRVAKHDDSSNFKFM